MHACFNVRAWGMRDVQGDQPRKYWSKTNTFDRQLCLIRALGFHSCIRVLDFSEEARDLFSQSLPKGDTGSRHHASLNTGGARRRAWKSLFQRSLPYLIRKEDDEANSLAYRGLPSGREVGRAREGERCIHEPGAARAGSGGTWCRCEKAASWTHRNHLDRTDCPNHNL